MKRLSLRFRTVARLEKFLEENFDRSVSVVVHISLPKVDDVYETIYETIGGYFKKFEVFGTCGDFSILNRSVVSDIVLSFFELDDAELGYCKNSFSCPKFDDEYFYYFYSVDFKKKFFLEDRFSKIDKVGTFYNEFVIYHDKIYKEGLVYLKIKKEYVASIKVVDSVEAIGRELSVDSDKKIEGFTLKNLYNHYLGEYCSSDLKATSKLFPLLKSSHDKQKYSMILSDDEKLDFELESDDKVMLGFSDGSGFFKEYEDVISSFDKHDSSLLWLVSSVAREEFFQKNPVEYDSALGVSSKSELVTYDGKVYDTNLSIVFINFVFDDSEVLRYKAYKSNIKKIKTDLKELEALATIAKKSSRELQELNKELEKRVHEEVEKNLKKDAILIHRSRLAQMGEMISLIAHQWKQPLSAISATSSGLQIKIELDMYDREFFLNSLTKIEEYVKHLSSTIDDFAGFFKPSKIKRKFFIKDAVEKALSIATYSLTKNSIDLVLDIDEELQIESYKNELVQVLLNIVKNAENILIKRKIKDPHIWIRVFKDNGKNIIEIEDNAGGIDKEIKSKIFEPYFSTKATKDSTGLGLYMSHFIVHKSLKGTIKVKNSQNGAVFSISLV